MNRRTLALSLALSLVVACASFAAQPDFTGKWRLDQDASKDLPQRYRDTVSDWTLDVARDAKTFTVDVSITLKDPAAAPVKNRFVHNLDGSESPVELTVRTPDGMRKVTATSKMTVLENGALDFVTSDERMRTTEHWKLDGDVLRISRTDETPRGPVSYELAFRRK